MQTLRLSLLAFVLLALAPLTAAAQTPISPATSVLFFDHDGSGPPTTFDRQIDNGAWTQVTPNRQSATSPVYWISFPALTPGPHTIRVRACNAAGCGESDPLAFVVAIVPAKPTTLRVGAPPAPQEEN